MMHSGDYDRWGKKQLNHPSYRSIPTTALSTIKNVFQPLVFQINNGTFAALFKGKSSFTKSD